LAAAPSRAPLLSLRGQRRLAPPAGWFRYCSKARLQQLARLTRGPARHLLLFARLHKRALVRAWAQHLCLLWLASPTRRAACHRQPSEQRPTAWAEEAAALRAAPWPRLRCRPPSRRRTWGRHQQTGWGSCPRQRPAQHRQVVGRRAACRRRRRASVHPSRGMLQGPRLRRAARAPGPRPQSCAAAESHLTSTEEAVLPRWPPHMPGTWCHATNGSRRCTPALLLSACLHHSFVLHVPCMFVHMCHDDSKQLLTSMSVA